MFLCLFLQQSPLTDRFPREVFFAATEYVLKSTPIKHSNQTLQVKDHQKNRPLEYVDELTPYP